MSIFFEIDPTEQNYWRAIVLFGRNSATYKFALAKSLCDLRNTNTDLIKLEELAPLFASHVCAHLKLCNTQATGEQSLFLEACRSFNEGKISHSDLIEKTLERGFNNVIDAFHVIPGAQKNISFFIDERKSNRGIRLTDSFSLLNQLGKLDDLNNETEARWRLVETAWSLNLPRKSIQVEYDEHDYALYTSLNLRRINITKARDALNGYQKSKCFYCFRNITTTSFSDDLADVDHFFPYMLKVCAGNKPINGVANLVLACQECNRGQNGKFDQIPSLLLLERLYKRNEYLIQSHHPLRETLIAQTGMTAENRKSFLQNVYECAYSYRIARWEPPACGESLF